jgi:hypothetical protein
MGISEDAVAIMSAQLWAAQQINLDPEVRLGSAVFMARQIAAEVERTTPTTENPWKKANPEFVWNRGVHPSRSGLGARPVIEDYVRDVLNPTGGKISGRFDDAGGWPFFFKGDEVGTLAPFMKGYGLVLKKHLTTEDVKEIGAADWGGRDLWVFQPNAGVVFVQGAQDPKGSDFRYRCTRGVNGRQCTKERGHAGFPESCTFDGDFHFGRG